jgi:hypothetical protein
MGHAFDVPYMGSPSADLLGGSDQGAEEASLAAKMRAICVSANDLINPLPPSHFYGSGWSAHHPVSNEGWAEEKHYWWADVAGAKFRVPVTLSAGDVAIYYVQYVQFSEPNEMSVLMYQEPS